MKMEFFMHLNIIFEKYGYSLKCQNTSNNGDDKSSADSGAYFSFEKLNGDQPTIPKGQKAARSRFSGGCGDVLYHISDLSNVIRQL